MPPKCQICCHPERAAIDRAIVENGSIRDIAGRFKVGRSSVDRHKKHIPKILAKAKQAETVAESSTLLSRVEKLLARCESLFAKAEEAKEWGAAASAAREIRGSLELLAKLSGELKTGGINVAITMNWIRSLNIESLPQAEFDALHQRVNERLFGNMTDEELDAEIEKLARERQQFENVPETTRGRPLQVIEGAR